jgi:hypothetical protein
LWKAFYNINAHLEKFVPASIPVGTKDGLQDRAVLLFILWVLLSAEIASPPSESPGTFNYPNISINTLIHTSTSALVLYLLKEKRMAGRCISAPIAFNTDDSDTVPELQALPPEA